MKFITGFVIAVTFASLAGCSDAPQMTKEQEEALRGKSTAPENFKGPDQASLDKMNEEIANYREKRKDDKVEFKTGN